MEFGDGFDGQNGGRSSEHTGFVDGRIVAVAVVHVGAVEQEIVGAAARAVDGKHAVRTGRIGDLVGRTGDTGNQENQLLVVAAVDREIGDDRRFDDAAESIGSGFHLRQGVAGDFDGLRDVAGLQK